jgi:hypothetical protein
MRWKSRDWMLVGLLLTLVAASGMAQVTTTQVADTIYHADGTVAAGTVIISWPAFTVASGESIPSGSTSAVIAADGALSVQLAPNAGSTPMGSYYTAVFHLDDGSVSREYWVVPVSVAPVRISSIESTVLPTSVAMQTVSKSYVDTAIAAAVTGHPLDSTPYVLKAGDTMTGPLALPADPVSATQAADKNYVDESIASVSGGLGQKVSTLPTATQVVTQPTGTQLDVNDLNAVEYASQYLSGLGGNGIANAVTSPDCAGGCEVKVEQDYPTSEPYYTQTLNNKTHVKDARGGRQVDSYKNPLDVVGNGLSIGQAIDDVSTQSEASLFQQTGNSIPASVGLAITQEGLAGGSNLFPEQIEDPPPYFKMTYNALTVKGEYNTQGQHGLVPEEIDCFGVGDCLLGSRVIYASGGQRDSADEGAHLYDTTIFEDYRVFAGNCISGCTTGSTTLMLSQSAGGGTQGDGRFLIDTNPAKTITSASTGGAIISGTAGGPNATAQFSGTSFPVSVFLSVGEVIPSKSNNMSPGTVTFAIATTGMPAGYAASTAAIGSSSGLACVIDQNNGYSPLDYEMAPYSVVDATHLQMTLNKPHDILATIAFGGLCGYGLEQTVDTAIGIRQLFPVIGSYSTTGLYYAGADTAVVGQMNLTGGFLNLNASIASVTRDASMVTVTTVGSLSADVNGLTLTVAGVADSSYNGNFAVTTTGPNTLRYAQSGANSSSVGGSISILTGGFALYPMAEVLSVFDPATDSVDGQMTLAPNNVAWAINDTVEEPHFYQESISGDIELIGQVVPRPTTQFRAGLQYQYNNTAGLTGWSITNGAPSTNYLGYGGTHGVPDAAYESLGIWRRTMSLTAGEQAVFGINCNLHGCDNWNSSYDLFELESSVGTDTIGFSPSSSSLSMVFRGAGYSFTPLGFTAGTINVGTLNATTINGALSSARITSGTIDDAVIGGTTPGPVSATQLNGLPVAEYTNTPRKPMATLLQALHNAKNQTVNIVVMSDSFGACDQTNCGVGPATPSNRYPEQLRINLQAIYGSHGTGMVPLTYNIGSGANPEYWAISGTHDTSTNTLGPYQTTLAANALVHLGNGAIATFTGSIPYDTIVTYCMTTTSTGSIAVAIDGVAKGTACGTRTGTATAHAVVSASSSLGTHTTTLTSTGDSFVYAAEGTAGSTGVSVHNIATGGATSQFFGGSPSTQLAFSDIIPGGTQAAIEMIQTNDTLYTPSISTFSAQVIATITHELALAGSPSFLMAIPPVDSVGETVEAPYTAAQIAIAQTQPIAFVNVQDRWGAAYNSAAGLWDLTGAYAGIHPNDKGSLDEYEMIFDELADHVPTTATINSGGGCGSGCTASGSIVSDAAADGFIANSTGASGTGNFRFNDSTGAEAGAIGFANSGFSGFLGGTTFVYSADHPICLSSVYALGCTLKLNATDGGMTMASTLPTGSCSDTGAWIFSQDGYASYCNGTIWSNTNTSATTAPSGSCTVAGAWVLSRDGRSSFCNGSVWSSVATLTNGISFAGNGTAFSGDAIYHASATVAGGACVGAALTLSDDHHLNVCGTGGVWVQLY